MSLLKRLRTTIYGHIDHTINQIENQDAVIDAIVREARQEVAKAKVRLARVEVDGKRMAAERGKLEEAITQWTGRAMRVRETDETRALDCLRQRKTCEKQLMDLSVRCDDHSKVVEKLRSDVRIAEQRVKEVLNKQHLMRTRESAANALRGANALDGNISSDLDATFDRWEVKVTESELLADTATAYAATSDLESEFISEEEEITLRDELAALDVELLGNTQKGGGNNA